MEHVGQARPRGSADGVEDEAGAEAGAEEKAGERAEEDVAERMKNNFVPRKLSRGMCMAGWGWSADRHATGQFCRGLARNFVCSEVCAEAQNSGSGSGSFPYT